VNCSLTIDLQRLDRIKMRNCHEKWHMVLLAEQCLGIEQAKVEWLLAQKVVSGVAASLWASTLCDSICR
jgi:hypothetical protein